jgi:ATP-dependent Lon protease
MEIIEIPGYTRREKLAIARQHLVPKQMEDHGLKTDMLEITDDAIEEIIEHWTREAGVRSLERQIAAICRQATVRIAEGEDVHDQVDKEHCEKVLGPYMHRPESAERVPQPGVVAGLSVTPAGGDILFVECTKMPGRGDVILTGNMRNVMQESATTAVSFVRSKADRLMLSPEWLRTIDLHLHLPRNAVPKDGPSAGVTMFTAVASLLLNAPVRADIAMTGEISLRGKVLPVGGIKEKLLAAHRAGMKEVLIPRENERDLEDIPKEIRDQLKIHLLSRMEEILPLVLLPPIESPVIPPADPSVDIGSL